MKGLYSSLAEMYSDPFRTRGTRCLSFTFFIELSFSLKTPAAFIVHLINEPPIH